MRSSLPCMTLGMIALVMCIGCGHIHQQPMHQPLYPASQTSITFTSTIEAPDGVDGVKLYEKVSTVSSSGAVTPGTEVLLDSWQVPGSPANYVASFDKVGGYPPNRLVEYRFVVKSAGVSDHRSVTFAISPYPVANMPVPVYAQGHPDDVFDVVFVPSTDIQNIGLFRERCRGLIQNSIHREPSINALNSVYNFYINPLYGLATDANSCANPPYNCHVLPNNANMLSFADGIAIVHSTNLQDYTLLSNDVFSTEWNYPNPFLHEMGHAVFFLADEHNWSSFNHWQADPVPNNWNSQANAASSAAQFGLSPGDEEFIERKNGINWYKLCGNQCAMEYWGLFDYGLPCQHRVVYESLRNLSQ